MLVLTVLSSLFLSVTGQYELRTGGSWKDAASNCSLASPTITFSRDDISVDIDDIRLDDGDTAWVGFGMAYEVFQYIGCVRKSDLDNNNIPHVTIQTARKPGQCSMACKNSTIFGLRNKDPACFCFETDFDDIKHTRNQCTKKCENNNFVCGNNGFVSLYTKAFIDQPKASDELCLSYEENEYKWSTCSEDKNSLCFNDSDDQLHIEDDKNNWLESTVLCFKEESYTMDRRAITVSLTENAYWLAYINTLTIKDIQDLNGTLPKEYGYVERNDDTYSLKFTEDVDKKSKAICKIDVTSSTTSSRKPSTVTSSTTSTTSISTSTAPTTSTIQPVTTATPVTPHPTLTGTTSNQSDANGPSPFAATQTSKDSNNKVGLYVGVSVAVLVCVGVAVLITFLCRRRRTQMAKEDNHTIVSQSNVTYNDLDHDLDNDNSYANLAMPDYVNTNVERSDVNDNVKTIGQDNTDIYDYARDVCDETATPSNKTTDNAYFVLEKEDQTSTAYFVLEKEDQPSTAYFVLEKEDQPSTAYFVLEKDDKPSTDSVTSPSTKQQTIHNEQTTHIYNTAQHNLDLDDYDHIGQKKKPHVLENGHYDTTRGVAALKDTMYDTTHGTQPGNHVTDDNYAHVGGNTDANDTYSKVVKSH